MTSQPANFTHHDHAVEPWTHGQVVLGSKIAVQLAALLAEIAVNNPDAHPDYRNALLQRAAVIAQDAQDALTDAQDEARPEDLDIFQHAQNEASNTFQAVAAIPSPHPGIERTDEHVDDLTGLPLQDDPNPDRYWRWLQRHVQALPLADWMEHIIGMASQFPAGEEPHSDLTAAASHALDTIAAQIGETAELPNHIPDDGISPDQLALIRQQAQHARQQATHILAALTDADTRASRPRPSPRAASHHAVQDAIALGPLQANRVRTVVATDQHPDGPIAAYIWQTNGEIRALLIDEPPPDDVPRLADLAFRCLLNRHVALDHQANGQEPPETVRVQILAAVHPASDAIRALTATVARDLLDIAAQRNVPDTAMHDALTALCARYRPIASFRMSDANFPPQMGAPEIIAAVANATTSPAVAIQVARALNHHPHLLDIPRDIVNPTALDAVIQAARRQGVTEHNINLLRSWTDTGTDATFTGPPIYEAPHTPPQTLYPAPTPTAVPAQCVCDDCREERTDAMAPHKDGLETAISQFADASALEDLHLAHQWASDDHNDRAAMLDALELATRRVEHHLALNRPHTADPFLHLNIQSQIAVNDSRQYLQEQNHQASNLGLSPRQNAVKLICLMVHAQRVAEIMDEKNLTPSWRDPDHLVRRAHVLYRNLARLNIIQEQLHQLSEQARHHAHLAVSADPSKIQRDVEDTYEDIVESVCTTLPELVSPQAQLWPELLRQARDNPHSPLGPAFAWTDDDDGLATSPAIARRYHDGALHYRMLAEPAPFGYPSRLMADEQVTLFIQVMTSTDELPTPRLIQQVKDSAFRASLGHHHIQEHARLDIQHAGRDAGISHETLHYMLDTLLGQHGHLPLPASADTPAFTDPDTARAAIAAAQIAGADDRILAHIAQTLGHPQLSQPPQPIATRHVRALARAARQRGLPLAAVNLMEQALANPAQYIAEL